MLPYILGLVYQSFIHFGKYFDLRARFEILITLALMGHFESNTEVQGHLEKEFQSCSTQRLISETK